MFVIALQVFGVLFALLLLLVLSPLVPMLMLKQKLGKRAVVIFFPIAGVNAFYEGSLKKHGDSYEDERRLIRQNPELQVIITNILFRPYLIFVDHKYSKEVFINNDRYTKSRFLPDG